MSTIPAHQRIRDDLVASIESGAVAARDRLPGEVELAARYGVTRMTVRQALTTLVNEGLLTRRRGVGTFVVENAAKRRHMNRLTSFTEDMEADGRTVETDVLEQLIVPPERDIAEALDLVGSAHAVHLVRLRIVDGAPTILQHSWLPHELFPNLWSEPLVGGSLYRTLATRYDVKPRRADQRIASVPAATEHAVLGVKRGTPLLRVERLTLDERNVPIEFARSFTRPGFEIAMHIER